MMEAASLNASPNRVLFRLALPAIVEQFLLTLVSYVDTAMVGSLGADATAAVAINASPNWLISGLLTAVGVGFSVQVAYAIGAKDAERVRRIFRQAVWATLAIGGIFFCLGQAVAGPLPRWMGAEPSVLPLAQGYMRILLLALPFQTAVAVFSAMLRCTGDTRTPLAVNLGANLLNVMLNYLLIYPTRPLNLFGRTWILWGAGLGVEGAAIASAASIALAGCLLLGCLFRKGNPCRIHWKEDWRFDGSVFRHALRLGLPVLFERVTMTGGQIVMTRLVAALGTVALAAHHVAITAEGISYMPAMGISFAATALCGQAMGADRREDVRAYGFRATGMGAILSTGMGLVLLIFAVPLAQLFSADAAVIDLAARMLRIVALSETMFGVSIVMSGALRGVGDTRFPFYVSLICMCGVRIAMALLLRFGFGMGLTAVWVAMVIDLNIRGILCLWRFRQKSRAQFAAEGWGRGVL